MQWVGGLGIVVLALALFPILGMSTETPFKLKKFMPNLTINPKVHFVISPGASNSNKISNEDSTNNDFSIDNMSRLNRFSGSDKMDNSKRITYGLSAYTSNFKSNLYQTYHGSQSAESFVVIPY